MKTKTLNGIYNRTRRFRGLIGTTVVLLALTTHVNTYATFELYARNCARDRDQRRTLLLHRLDYLTKCRRRPVGR